MNEYQPSVWHYLISAFLFVAGTAAYWWYTPLTVALYALGSLSAAFIFVMGVWDRVTADKYALASAMDSAKGLSKEQQDLVIGKYPEISLLLGQATLEPAFMVGDCGVPFRFFVEFMGMEGCNEYHTASKRSLNGNGRDTREQQRDWFDRLTKYLMTCPGHYLAAAPVGNETYQWRAGAYLQLWNSYVLPYADLVDVKVLPIPVERTPLYQEDVERI